MVDAFHHGAMFIGEGDAFLVNGRQSVLRYGVFCGAGGDNGIGQGFSCGFRHEESGVSGEDDIIFTLLPMGLKGGKAF